MATFAPQTHHNGPIDAAVRLDRAIVATFAPQSRHNGPLGGAVAAD